MTASLLAALGLPPPAHALPGQAPAGPKQPTGPIRAPGIEPREELPARRPPAQGKGTSQPPGSPVPTTLRMRRQPVGTGGLPPNLRPQNPDRGSADKPDERECEPLKGIAQVRTLVEKVRVSGKKKRRK